MPEPKSILLVTLNSSYFHTAFGLRYLFANLGKKQKDAKILEFTTQQNPRDIAEEILSYSPKIVGLGVYIWNTTQSYELVSILKSIRPDLKIVLGGPEVSYEYEDQPIVKLADHLICGEGEEAFRHLCENIETTTQKVFPYIVPEIKNIKYPYAYFSDEDIKNRVIYVEASRGCPYKCEFCLSSLDKSVRAFELESFLNEIQLLIDKGARTFKFVDRTFNLNYKTSYSILKFFLDRISLGLFIHFELVPDRLPLELKEIIAKFPKGSLQFEVGIQTWNEKVAELVSRKQDYTKTEENLRFLRNETGVHLHTDLIAGLPGESLESFAFGFDKLFSLSPHEIQVGILKRLKGTPIIRHDKEFEMGYQSTPPFPILKNKNLTFEQLQSIQRFAKFWDLYGNSGNFKRTLNLLVDLANKRIDRSLFWEFWQFIEFLNLRHPQRHSIALLSLVESIWHYLKDKVEIESLRTALIADYSIDISRDIPKFLRTEESARQSLTSVSRSLGTPKRQALHLRNH